MAVSSGMSFALSSVVSLLIFSGMQMYKQWLTSSQPLTLLGGFLGSLFFLFFLTAVGSLESTLFGKGFQMKLFPEILICLAVSVTAAGMVHRICATVCLILSIFHLFQVNQLSQKTYQPTATATAATVQAKKKK